MQQYLSISPISHLDDPLLKRKRIKLYLKRDDLIAGACQGNKIRKLKFQVQHLPQQEKKQILTFGGAFSNHIYAVAGFGAERGIETIGIIRGEFDGNNPTIRKVLEWGMQLHFVNRGEYRHKNSGEYLSELQKKFPLAHIVPEGGNHPEALPGILEMVKEVREQHSENIDYWVCPYATGCTAVGISQGLHDTETLCAFVVLKGLDLTIERNKIGDQCITFYDAHYGGFAKRSREVEAFIKDFYRTHQIILDPIYTGRMMHALYQQIEQEEIKPGSNIMVIHTGGHQGTMGYNYRFGTVLPTRAGF